MRGARASTTSRFGTKRGTAIDQDNESQADQTRGHASSEMSYPQRYNEGSAVPATPAHFAQPALQPAVQPISQPATQLAAQFPAQPALQPAMQPVVQSTVQPAVQLAMQPVAHPVVQPLAQPVTQPTMQPAAQPAVQTTVQPIAHPMVQFAAQPAAQPAQTLVTSQAQSTAQMPTAPQTRTVAQAPMDARTLTTGDLSPPCPPPSLPVPSCPPNSNNACSFDNLDMPGVQGGPTATQEHGPIVVLEQLKHGHNEVSGRLRELEQSISRDLDALRSETKMQVDAAEQRIIARLMDEVDRRVRAGATSLAAQLRCSALLDGNCHQSPQGTPLIQEPEQEYET